MIDPTILAQYIQAVFMPFVPLVAGAVITMILLSTFIVLFDLFLPKEDLNGKPFGDH